MAKEGGVLRRAGHTEAAVDLARMAGLHAGRRALRNPRRDRRPGQPRPSCSRWPAEFDLPIISIEQLIAYRRVREKLVYREAEAKLPTKYGTGTIIAYGVKYESQQPLVFVLGDPTKRRRAARAAALVVLHRRPARVAPLRLRRPAAHGPRHDQPRRRRRARLPAAGRPRHRLVEKIKAYALQDQGLDTVEANLALGYKADPRDYGVGIQLLKDLGLRKVRLLTNNPKKTDAFIYGGFDLEVVDQVPIVPPINEHNAAYLATKRDKLGHRLP